MTDALTPSSVDALLDRAIAALNRGDVSEARELAGEVLASEGTDVDAGHLVTTDIHPEGEIRRLTVLFSDLVGSTELSSRLEVEQYRTIVARYQHVCRGIIQEQYGGWVVSLKGDGILAAFGFPVPHENDAERAVRAGLDIAERFGHLASAILAEHGEQLGVRVAVHKGIVFLDLDERDLYGFAVNVAARLEGLAEPGTVLVSEPIRRLLGDRFDLDAHPPREVKGVDGPLATFTVLGPSLGAAPRAPRVAQLMARREELTALRDAWRAARESNRTSGACVVIAGESGMGKTRLVRTLAAEVEPEGGVVIELDGSSFQEGYGLWPVRRLIEQRCGFTRHTDAAARLRLLAESLDQAGLAPEATPLLAALIGLGPEAGYVAPESDARRLREHIGDAAFAYVAACLGDGPALLVCEDAQWFDDETCDLLTRSLKELGPGIAVVVTSRDPARAPRGSQVEVLALEPLEYADRIELMRSLGGDTLPVAVLVDIANRSDGVPLFVEELLQGALQEAAPGPGPDVGGDAHVPDMPAVPEVLYEPLLSRLYVTPSGASVAAAAAAIGREADRELLVKVSGLTREELDDAIAALLGGLILERVEHGQERYRFRHELVRAVAYDIQPPTRRRELHGRVADTLVKDAADDDSVDWDRVATHYEAAERTLDAADAFEHAATAARRRGALMEARSLVGRGVDILAANPSHGRPDREVVLLLQRAFLSITLEGNTSAQAALDYERCLELSMASPESDEMRSTLFCLWAYYLAKGQLDRSQEVLDVLSRSLAGDDPAFRFLTAAGYALVAGYRGDSRESMARAEEANLLMRTSLEVNAYELWWFFPLDPRASNHMVLGLAHLVAGNVNEALPHAAAARAACEPLPFPQGALSLAANLSFESFIHIELGALEQASAVLDEIVAIADRHGLDGWSIVAATQREIVNGFIRARDATTDDDRLAVAGHAVALGGYLSMWKMLDQWIFLPFYTTSQGALHAAAGQVEEARATFQESLAIGERTGMHFYDSESLRHLARLQPDPEEQAEGIRAAIEVARAQHSVFYELRAAVDLHRVCGDLEPMRAAVEKFVPTATSPELDAARALLTAR